MKKQDAISVPAGAGAVSSIVCTESGDDRSAIQKYRDQKNPYVGKAADDARDDARARLPEVHARTAASAIGNDAPNHNVLTLAHALAYVECGLHVIDSHALNTRGKGTAPNGQAKVPRGAKWQVRASNDSAEVLRFWTGDGEYPADKNGDTFPFAGPRSQRNVSIAFPDGCGLFVLDIDGDEGLQALDALEDEHGKLPATWESETGSGGLHLIFRGEGLDIRNTASCIAPGVDIRGKNGQIIAPPSIHPNGQFYRWADGRAPWECEVAEAPEWLRSIAYEATKGRGSQKPKAANSGKGPASAGADTRGFEAHLSEIGDGDGRLGFDAPIYSAACAYFARQGADADAEPLLDTLRETILAAPCDNDRAERRYATDEYLETRVGQAREFIEENSATGTPHLSMDISDPLGDTMPDALATLDQRWAYVNQSGKVVYVRRPDPARERDEVLEGWSGAAFREFHSDRSILEERETDDGSKIVKINPASEWTEHARRYSRVTFAPPPLYSHPNDYNLWNVFDPMPKGNPSVGCAKFKWFLLHVICDGRQEIYDWLWLWLAHAVQKPGEKPGTALVIQGDGGSGKSTLGELLHALFGAFSIHASNPEHVTGKFNKHQATAIMMVSDEALYGGDPRVSSIIKDMVTSRKQRVEPKGIDSFEVDSCMRCVFIGNPKKVVPIEANGSDRRYLCLTVSNVKRGDTGYFEMLREEAEAGGLAALYQELMEYEPAEGLTWRDVRTAPMTPERRAMRWLSLRPAVRAAAEIIADGQLEAREDGGRVVHYSFSEDAPTYVVKEHVRLALRHAANNRDSRDDVGEVLEELLGKGAVTDTRRQVSFNVVFDGELNSTDGGETPQVYTKDRAHAYRFPPLSEMQASLDARFLWGSGSEDAE